MKSLLIIDDDEDICDALQALLTEDGYQINLATSGKQGLELAQAAAPQVILLDWQMPQLNGHQVLLILESSPKLKDVPVILMSANISDIPAEIRAERRHLKKPFDIDAVTALVAQVAERRTTPA